MLFGCLGAAALAALAGPLARLLAGSTAGPQTVGPVAAGVAGFAPGLVGYALFALLSRALYARGDTRLAAAATVLGWAVVAVASIGLAEALPRPDRVAALAWANSAGMLVLGGVLVAMVARRAGGAALSGFARAGLTGVVAAGAAAAAGIATVRLTPDGATALGQGVLGGAAVGTVFLGVAYALDRPDVAPALAALVSRVRRARS